MMKNKSDKYMAKARSSVKLLVGAVVKEIVSLAKRYRDSGKDFQFSSFPELDRAVDDLLVKLSDDVLADTLEKMRLALEEADMDVEYGNVAQEVQDDDRFGMLPIERIDSHASHLKWFIEGALAVSFVYGIADRFIPTYIMRYMENPVFWKEWREAMREGQEYAATIIQEGGPHYGRGVQRDPVGGMTLTEETMISEGYQRGVLMGYMSAGAIGYRVHRGSDYDCPSCDELCVGVHPLSEVVLPNHPRCKCWTTPVFNTDDIE